ncbi:type II toxin-antitoxin system RelE/ParE family toxin [Candidatus Peregrinibacteria bacterium]|nr:type II toxin-antitoxin system RelE/ParE family toxin [Candidatus Peregrinibacteria bacterium]
MKIVFAPNALRELYSFQKKDQLFLQKKLSELMEYENVLDHPKVKKLRLLPYYRYRAGDFRIFFDAEGNIITIYKISRRSEKTYR